MRNSGQTIYLGKILEFATVNSVSAPTLPFLLGYSYTLCFQPGASCVLPSACVLLAGHPFLLTGLVNSITSRQLYSEAHFYTATNGKSLPFDLSICSSRSILSASWFKVFQILVPLSYRAVIQGGWMVNKELGRGTGLLSFTKCWFFPVIEDDQLTGTLFTGYKRI